MPTTLELARSTEAEKQSQLTRLADFHARHAAEAPAMLQRLQQAVIDNGNVFEVLMDAVRVCSLGADHRRPVRGGRAVPAQHVTITSEVTSGTCQQPGNKCTGQPLVRGPVEPLTFASTFRSPSMRNTFQSSVRKRASSAMRVSAGGILATLLLLLVTLPIFVAAGAVAGRAPLRDRRGGIEQIRRVVDSQLQPAPAPHPALTRSGRCGCC